MQYTSTISRNILIEDLINNYSFSVRYLMEKGIRCIRCGEPIWGTLEEAAKEKDFDDEAIDTFVKEMNDLAGKMEVEKR
ncbi:MAG: DUF1858 domain-containing protein [Bacteroidetes bacterium]|nr:MAG: DUF1858 domain-containing protein [Bacteroidota bacterium]